MTRTGSAVADSETREKSRLFHALLRFANASATPAQKCFALPDESRKLLRSVLLETDETVLPREITLTSDIGTTARLIVSNRRLTLLTIDNKAAVPPDQAPPDPSSLARLYVEKIKSFTKNCAEISITVSPVSGSSRPSGLSCSASALAETAGFRDFGVNSDSSLNGFVKNLKELSSAWIKSDFCSGVDEMHGSSDLTELLEQTCQAAVENGVAFTPGPQFGSKLPICVLLPVSDDRLVTILVSQGMTFLALTGISDRQVICENWHNVAATVGIDRT